MTNYKPQARSVPTHELRTPIHAMQGAIELLLDGSVGKLSLEAREIVGLISSSLRQLSQAVDQTVQLANFAIAGEAYRELVPVTGLCRGTEDLPAEYALHAVEICRSEVMRALSLLEGSPKETSARELRLDGKSAYVSGLIGYTPKASGDGALAWLVANILLERSGCALEVLGADVYRVAIPLSTSGAGHCETRPSSSRNTSSCGSSMPIIASSESPE